MTYKTHQHKSIGSLIWQHFVPCSTGCNISSWAWKYLHRMDQDMDHMKQNQLLSLYQILLNGILRLYPSQKVCTPLHSFLFLRLFVGWKTSQRIYHSVTLEFGSWSLRFVFWNWSRNLCSLEWYWLWYQRVPGNWTYYWQLQQLGCSKF